VLYGECGWGLLVEFGDLVENIDSFLLLALGQEELGRLVEVENKVSEEEDEQSHAAEDDKQISPSHVGLSGAACPLTGVSWVLTSQNIWIASVFGDGAVGDTRSSDNTNRLPHGEERYEVSSILR